MGTNSVSSKSPAPKPAPKPASKPASKTIDYSKLEKPSNNNASIEPSRPDPKADAPAATPTAAEAKIDYSGLEKSSTNNTSIKPSRPEPRAPIPPTKAEVLNQLGRKIGSVTALDANTRAMTAALVGQDFPAVEVGDDVGILANKVHSFLGEVASDNQKLGKLGAEQARLTKQYTTEATGLEDQMKRAGWSQAKLKTEAPSEMGQLDVAAGNLEKSSAMMADAGAGYAKSVEAKANEYLTAWDQTARNETKKGNMAVLNAVLDLATASGIGGNAITQLATKEIKAGLKTLGQATNAIALRGGQIGDLLQAGINSSITMTHLGSASTAGALEEITGIEAKADSALDNLVERLQTFVAYREAQEYEGLVGF